MANDFFSYGGPAAPAPAPGGAGAPAAPGPSTLRAPGPAGQAVAGSQGAAASSAQGAVPVPVRLLADLGDEDWEKLIAYTAQRRYPAGAVIVRAGDRSPALFFVASGTVRVTARPSAPPPDAVAPVALTRGEGEVFGLLSFLDGAPHAADVTAASEVELLMLTPDGLTQLAAWQPRIAVALLRDLGAHVAARLRPLQAAD